jgi:hypothetical protein
MSKEDFKLVMIRRLFEIMKDNVENCDHERILNSTTNLAINLDRAITGAGGSKDLDLQRKLMSIDNDMSVLKGIFATKCNCTKK